MSSGVDLGLIIYSAVKPIFKIYFIVGIGFWLAKRNVLTVATCRDISDTIVTAILPCLVFENIVSSLQSSDIKSIGIIFFTALLLFGFGVSLAFFISIVAKSPKRWFGGILSVGLFPNISDLPIAYVQTLSNGGKVFSREEGDKGVAYICIFLAAQALFQFSFGLYELIAWDFRPELLDEEEKTKGSNMTTSSSNNSNVKLPTIYTNGPPHSPGDQTPKRHPPSDIHDGASIATSIASDEENELPPPLEVEGSTPSKQRSGYYKDVNQILTKKNSKKLLTSRSNNSQNLSLTTTRSIDLRTQPSQDIRDVINEYSEYDDDNNNSGITNNNYDQNRDQSKEMVRSITGGSDIGGTSLVSSHSHHSLQPDFKTKLKLRLRGILKNLVAPTSSALIISIIVSMAPPLKALFVHSDFDIPDAPDSQPPLSFIMDITSYIGAASVPLGLLLLGATISRLQVKTMPKGFWKTALGITLSRLVLLPIIGVGVTTGLHAAGWYGDDKLIRFISVLEYGLPSATSLVYFTAFYTDPNSDDHIQMDCLAVVLIFQYSILFISLPFLVSFSLKVSLNY